MCHVLTAGVVEEGRPGPWAGWGSVDEEGPLTHGAPCHTILCQSAPLGWWVGAPPSTLTPMKLRAPPLLQFPISGPRQAGGVVEPEVLVPRGSRWEGE